MKTLYVVRHGVAVPFGTEGIADDDRTLTKQGERKVREIGQGLKRLRIKLDAITSSPLPRASRTAEILATELGLRESLSLADALRANQSATQIHDWLHGCVEDHLMIVGHHPSFSDLIGLLLGAGSSHLHLDLRKAGIAAFTVDPLGAYHLDWLARPRLLRNLG